MLKHSTYYILWKALSFSSYVRWKYHCADDLQIDCIGYSQVPDFLHIWSHWLGNKHGNIGDISYYKNRTNYNLITHLNQTEICWPHEI